MVKLRYLDRFGVQAVFGRTLGAGEMRRMVACENIVKAYQERAQSDNWAEWASKNKQANALLIQAMKAAEDGE